MRERVVAELKAGPQPCAQLADPKRIRGAVAGQLRLVDETDDGYVLGLQAVQQAGGHGLEIAVVLGRYRGKGQVVEGDRYGAVRQRCGRRGEGDQAEKEEQPACHVARERRMPERIVLPDAT